MDNFIKLWHNLAPLTATAIEDLAAIQKQALYTKDDLLLQAGQTCKNLYFIEQGLVKMFFFKEDKEFIMRFFPENSLVTGLDSYIMQMPSDFSIRALETTTITYVSKKELELLCKKHACLEEAYRNFFALVSLNMMKRISEMLEENAGERYNNFIRDNGQLLQRISLGDLSGYIGITQVSLSRIRGKK